MKLVTKISYMLTTVMIGGLVMTSAFAQPYHVFDAIGDKIIEIEGGYVNDPTDRGGETKYGISKRSYPNADIKNLTVKQAKAIYFSDFWVPTGIYKISNKGLAWKVFSFSVHAGQGRAIKMLQKSLTSLGYHVAIDGRLGPQTLSAISQVDSDELTETFTAHMRQYYRAIVRNKPSQEKYLKGWLNRAEESL